MEYLHELLTTQRAEVIRRWTESIGRSLAPAAITRLELVDHLPGFLDEVTASLRRKIDGRSPTEPSPAAREHGVQRLRLGFDLEALVLEALVREYGMLRTCIVEMAKEAGLSVRQEELDTLFDSLITGIADAVTQYAAERQAEQRRQANEHFAFVAHELRNPLSAAQLALSSLQTKGLLPSTRQIEIVHRGLNRMRDLIEQSLGLAFLGAGIELHRKRLGMRNLVAEAALDATAEAEDGGVNLRFQSDADEEVNVDHRLALSALTNLISNAVKFTHAGGTVQVRWHRTAEHVNVEVQDECGGLPPGKTEKLFAPFIQAGTDRSGFGLGLAIARQAAEPHGGSIKVRDLPGKGCVFTLELPTS